MVLKVDPFLQDVDIYQSYPCKLNNQEAGEKEKEMKRIGDTAPIMK